MIGTEEAVFDITADGEAALAEPMLLSPRLRLRRLRTEDASAIRAYRSLPDVARFQSWESFTPEDAARLVAGQANVVVNTPDTWLQLALVDAGSRAVIGDCGIHFCPGDGQQVELGITLSPDHQGHGLAEEALNAVLYYVFGTLNKHRAWAVTDVENHRAARLLGRVGFRQEAHFEKNAWFKGRWGSEYLFALLRREWQDRSSLSAPDESR